MAIRIRVRVKLIENLNHVERGTYCVQVVGGGDDIVPHTYHTQELYQ